MDKKPLSTLISELEQELLRLGYTKGSMTFYRRRWKQLMEYAEKRGEQYYTEQLGIDFVYEFFGITQEDFARVLPQAETQELRVIRMVGDFQLHHAVLRRYMKHKEILTNPFFLEIKQQFQEHCVKKGYSPVTTDHYVKQSSYMMDYLTSNNMLNFDEVNIEIIYSYMVLGIQNYYRIAMGINHDCRVLHRAVMTVFTNRLLGGNRLTKDRNKGRNLTKTELERFGKSSMLRFSKSCGLPIYPIGYVQHKNPMGKKRTDNPYTPEGRSGKHNNLQINTHLMQDIMLQPQYGKSVEYADNRISLFSAQWGKCAVTGKSFEILEDIHCHPFCLTRNPVMIYNFLIINVPTCGHSYYSNY